MTLLIAICVLHIIPNAHVELFRSQAAVNQCLDNKFSFLTSASGVESVAVKVYADFEAVQQSIVNISV